MFLKTDLERVVPEMIALHEEGDDEEEEATAITITSMLKVVEVSVPLYQTTDKVFFDAEASRHAEMLIRACGKDAKKTTFADMEELDLRLECVACDPGKHRQAMQWRSAVREPSLSEP